MLMLLHLLLELACASLFALGCLFVFIQIRSKFDRSFLFFGLSLISMSCTVGVDIWGASSLNGKPEQLVWWRFQHLTFAITMAYMVIYIQELYKKVSKVAIFWLLFTAALVGLSSYSDISLYWDGKNVVSGYGYIVTVVYLVVYTFLVIFYNVVGIKKVSPEQKKILKMHLFGIALLFPAGFMDMLTIVHVDSEWPSFTIFGLFFFGITTAIIFTERFISLVLEREKAFERLKQIHQDMGSASVLKELGKSTAIISHQIKNHMNQVSYWAKKIKDSENLSPRGLLRVENLYKASESIRTFTQDLLDISKSQILQNTKTVDLWMLVKTIIESRFNQHASAFHLVNANTPVQMNIQWEKMEQALINLFDNAIEASQEMNPRIEIEITEKLGVILMRIEDWGKGCSEEDEKRIFDTFFTTKSNKSGSGLGLSLVSSVIQGHGGSISGISKTAQVGQHRGTGMKFLLCFPAYENTLLGKKLDELVVLKQGIQNIEPIARILSNVNAQPYFMNDGNDLFENQYTVKLKKVLGTSEGLKSIPPKILKDLKIFVLGEIGEKIYILSEKPHAKPELFSEEFVLKNIL